jgi:hypothetical protein
VEAGDKDIYTHVIVLEAGRKEVKNRQRGGWWLVAQFSGSSDPF